MFFESLLVNNVYDCGCFFFGMFCLWICVFYLYELYMDLVEIICMYFLDIEEGSILVS